MTAIDKVSDITVYDIAEYAHIGELDEGDLNALGTFLAVAKAYIAKYTGHTEAELDDSPDFIPVVFVLCQDMWDNRGLYQDGQRAQNLNFMVESVLAMHSVNYL